MPHDVVSPEFSIDDPELADLLPSHDSKGSQLLAAMKKAGNALVRKVKRIAPKAVLSAIAAVGAVVAMPQAARAQSCTSGLEVWNPYLGACFTIGDALPTGPGLGPPYAHPGACPVGDPVDAATGNVFMHVTDYTTAGPNPLQFIRYYNSMPSQASVNTLSYSFGNVDSGIPSAPLSLTNVPNFNLRATNFMGGPASGTPDPNHWRTNYDRYLQFTLSGGTLTKVIAERPDGQQITFTNSGGTWTPPSDQDYTLTQSGSTWTLTDRNDTKESYTDSGAGWAQVNTITARNGYQQTLNYGVTTPVPVAVSVFEPLSAVPTATAYYPNLLQSVTDSYGRSLTMAYDSSTKLLNSVSTPDALVVSYGYTYSSNAGGMLGPYSGDAGYLLTSVSYNMSPASSLTYNYAVTSMWPYQIKSVVDENGNTAATWRYNTLGQAVESYQGGGGVAANDTSFGYSSGSTTVTNVNGVNDTYNYSILQGVQKITSVSRDRTSNTAAATRTFTYDSNGFLASATDWNGNQTNYTGDSRGQPVSITEAYGTAAARTTSVAYDTTFVHLPATITTTGLTRSFTYDASGNPLTMTDTDTTTNTVPYSTNGQTRTTQWTWDTTGEMLSVQLPRTDLTAKYTFTWSSGALASVTDPVGNATSITSTTGGGYPLTIVDPNSVTTTLAYDTRLNLNSSTLSITGGSLVTTYTHDKANNLTAVQRPDGSTLSYAYDAANRLTTVTDLPGNTVDLNLDFLGNSSPTTIQNTSSATQFTASAMFDKLGRKLTDKDANFNITSYTYDPNGNVLTATDALSNVTTYTYDALNRLTTRADPSPGGTTTFTYDAHNRLTNVQDANGNSTSYVRDGFGEVTQLTSPDTNTTVYHYDKDRNLTQKVLAGGQTVNFTYDANDRNLTIAYPADSTLNVAKTYDQSGHGKGVGRLTSVTDQAGSDSFTYDERGNVTSETRVITGAGTLTTSTTYDAASNISSITYPSGTIVNYSRDSMGQVTGVSATPPGASSATNIATSITHQPFGPVKHVTYGNGVTGTYTFDRAYNASTREDSATASDITNLTYAYDARNSLTGITDTVNAANSQTMTYDNLDRLSTATSGTGGYGSYAWTWDKVNNVASQTINPGIGSVATAFSQNSGTNQLASLAVSGGSATTVDTMSNGNIVDFKIGATTLTNYSYNAANQMSAATGPLGMSATYAYGFDGQRLEKSPPGSYPILYQYSRAANELLSENNLNGTGADYIYMDPGKDSRPIGQVDPNSGSVYFTHTDRQGTPQALTNSSQTVVWSAMYNPFGDNPVGGITGTLTTQSLRLPGQTFDAETGLNHNGFRDYSGTLTRYVQSDPIGLLGGMNTYQYVSGNPFKYTDPKGLDPGGDPGCPLLRCPTFNAPDDGEPDPDPLPPPPKPPLSGGGPRGGPTCNPLTQLTDSNCSGGAPNPGPQCLPGDQNMCMPGDDPGDPSNVPPPQAPIITWWNGLSPQTQAMMECNFALTPICAAATSATPGWWKIATFAACRGYTFELCHK